jgi:hypothetical protein
MHLVRVVLLGVLASGTAAADGFSWQAPSGCPTAHDVLSRIERRLDAGTAVGDITVIVRRAGEGFRARLDTRAISVAGQGRTLSATKCDALADAIAVIVARLATDAHRAKEPAIAPDPVVPTMRPPRRFNSLARTRGEPERPEWNAGVRLLALSGIGITPKVGYGGEMAAFVHRHDTFAELGYARWAERPTYVFPTAQAHVDVGVSLLSLRGGWASDRMPLRGWLGVEVGSMHGIGVMTPTPDQGSGRWAAVAGGFGVGWPITTRTRVVGTFEVAAPVERARFTLANGTEIYQPAPASARCAVGLEVGWR